MPVHHLRRIYPDPMTGQVDWQLIRLSTGIIGVGSQSSQPTIKKSGFKKEYAVFEGTGIYSEWKFAIRP